MITTKDLNRIKLYLTAVSFLGKDASPNDLANDVVGCADTVSSLILSAFGKIIKYSVSTQELNILLANSPQFMKVTEFKAGDIIISPTGLGNGKLANGHVGIMGENEQILSNSSAIGTLENNFTLTSWVAKYRTTGGFPVIFYRKL